MPNSRLHVKLQPTSSIADEMSNSRRITATPKQELRLPSIAFSIPSVLYDRTNVRSQPQESPRSSSPLNGQTRMSPRNTKSSPDYLGNNRSSLSLSPERFDKTWNVHMSDKTVNQSMQRSSPVTKETGLYDPKLNDMYALLSQRERSVVLPPLESPKATNFKVLDQDKLREKMYVLEDLDTQPIVSKFERDEVFIPSVYSKHFACRECRTAYVTTMFTKQYVRRNKRNPKCSKPSDAEKERRHFCDVLGKRFCASCIERENRKFSKSLQRSLPQKLTDFTHESHSSRKPKKVMNIDLRFASQ